jgi:hypothetical protein
MNLVTTNHKLAVATILIALIGSVAYITLAKTELVPSHTKTIIGTNDSNENHKADIHKNYIKPGAAVRLVSPAQYSLATGDLLPLDIVLSNVAIGVTKVDLSAVDGLSIVGETTFFFEGKKEILLPISVQAEAEQLAYLNIYIEHTDNIGQRTTRALAIAFDSRTADQVLLSKPKIAKPYVEMQATESIR